MRSSYLTVFPCSLSIFTMSAMGYCALAAQRPQPKYKTNSFQPSNGRETHWRRTYTNIYHIKKILKCLI